MGRLETLASIGVTLLIAHEVGRLAFSRQTKDEIKQRARQEHDGRLLSEISHTNGVPMECAHINHSRSYPEYDSPENGFYCTIYEHLQDHINREGQNGLSIPDNRRAIRSLEHRVKVWEQVKNLDRYYQLTATPEKVAV